MQKNQLYASNIHISGSPGIDRFCDRKRSKLINFPFTTQIKHRVRSKSLPEYVKFIFFFITKLCAAKKGFSFPIDFFFFVLSGLYPLVIFHHNPSRLNRRRQIYLRDACIRLRKMIPK